MQYSRSGERSSRRGPWRKAMLIDATIIGSAGDKPPGSGTARAQISFHVKHWRYYT